MDEQSDELVVLETTRKASSRRRGKNSTTHSIDGRTNILESSSKRRKRAGSVADRPGDTQNLRTDCVRSHGGSGAVACDNASVVESIMPIPAESKDLSTRFTPNSNSRGSAVLLNMSGCELEDIVTRSPVLSGNTSSCDSAIPKPVPTSITLDTTHQKDAKYIVRFGTGDFQRDYYMNDDDPLEIIYESLFGNDRERRIFYEGMKLSRLLSVGESGFFPGINYVYLPDDETLPLPPKTSVTVKFDDNAENDLAIVLESADVVGSVLERIELEKGMDLSGKCLIYNGTVLDEQSKLGDLIEDGIIDVVDCNDVC